MGSIGSIAHAAVQWPAFWGVLGAFAFAGPRFLPCLSAAHDARRMPWGCIAELAIALVIGGIGAAALTGLVAGLVHVKDTNAVAAILGLLANPCVPRITGAAPALLSGLLDGPIAKALKGDGPHSGDDT